MQLVFYIRACYTNCPMYIPLGSPSHTHLSYVFSFSDNFPRNRSRSSTNCFSHSKSSRHQLQDHENESPIHGYIPLTLTSLSTTKENNLGYLIDKGSGTIQISFQREVSFPSPTFLNKFLDIQLLGMPKSSPCKELISFHQTKHLLPHTSLPNSTLLYLYSSILIIQQRVCFSFYSPPPSP